ncbi:MAG: GAF domain-containing protein [Candidatus Riflebacteria bacterium]|nr:GAF domain-containing protein [Candidatus Riflebacteria bacterium]
MNQTIDIVNRILSHRLQQDDIVKIFGFLSQEEREEFLTLLAEILEKVAAILDVSTRMVDTSSLNNLLALMIQITSETVHAERGTLFMYDSENDELFSRVTQGAEITEIRFPARQGIAGSVFQTGTAVIIDDAYADARFNREIDQKTGFRTRTIVCAPIKTRGGQVIGALQLLNKATGGFTQEDLSLLEVITSHAAAALQNAHLYEQVQRARNEETYLLEVTTAISSELQLKPLLQKIMESIVSILDAERATLFLFDEKNRELWSSVATGLENREIRIPCTVGIAGSVFQTGETINIPDAYADSRFNQEVDRKTGFQTRSILCMPVVNRHSRIIGVSQVLNKKGGPFNRRDEKKLRAFSAQAAVAIENAKLFDDVLNMKNYNESVLESLNTGVVTLNERRRIETANTAALRTFAVDRAQIIGKGAEEFFAGRNHWIAERVERVLASGKTDLSLDAEIAQAGDRTAFVNFSGVPLHNTKQEPMGALVVVEDVTKEKRLRGALSRYMPKEVAERLADAEAVLGGQIQEVSVLFSDIRGFTSISEAIGPQETVAFLNAYFTEMVEIIFKNGGILDKYIGDAILSVFGTPFPSGEDADRAVTTAVEMMRALRALNVARAEAGQPPLGIGIGINTDKVLVGNIGSLKRMDYTVIGDGVNLASRLESACKFYHAGILVSELTLRQLKRSYLTREVDCLRVKGKQQPVWVHEVFDPEAVPGSGFQDFLGHYRRGQQAYRGRDFPGAGRAFLEAEKIRPDDHLVKMYLERCEIFVDHPPPADWDGVWTMKEK